jgi:hypothetical protein
MDGFTSSTVTRVSFVTSSWAKEWREPWVRMRVPVVTAFRTRATTSLSLVGSQKCRGRSSIVCDQFLNVGEF